MNECTCIYPHSVLPGCPVHDLDLDVGPVIRLPIRVIYRVYHTDVMGCDSSLGHFESLESAKQCFYKHIEELKKSESTATKEDLDDEENLQVKEGHEFLKNIILRSTYHYWSEPSYEYNESDIYQEEIYISKVPVYA
jgi:hypothetical protein